MKRVLVTILLSILLTGIISCSGKPKYKEVYETNPEAIEFYETAIELVDYYLKDKITVESGKNLGDELDSLADKYADSENDILRFAASSLTIKSSALTILCVSVDVGANVSSELQKEVEEIRESLYNSLYE